MAILMMIIVLLLSGCAAASDSKGVSPTRQEDEIETLTRLAQADLAKRLGVTVDKIATREVIPTEFPDSSLGVPEPGKSYLTVITPGYVIKLVADGREYVYHGSKDHVVAVPEPQEQPTDEETALISLAKADLSLRLGVAADRIGVVGVSATEFSDTSLGVPEPGKVYAQVITPGYVITLSVAEQGYAYHGSGDRVVLATDPRAPLALD